MLLDRIEDETKGVDKTAERGPSGVTDVEIDNFARFVVAEEMRASCATLGGNGLSESGILEDGSCTDGELSITGLG